MTFGLVWKNLWAMSGFVVQCNLVTSPEMKEFEMEHLLKFVQMICSIACIVYFK